MSNNNGSSLNTYRNYDNTRDMLKRNEQFLDETIKSINLNKPKLNTLNNKSNGMIYDIITSPVELEGYAVDAVIDSAANFSMISLSLAKKLNLPLYKND